MKKNCNCCGTEKPYAEFPRKSASKDGHAGICKHCIKLKREGVIAIDQRRYKTGPHKAQRRDEPLQPAPNSQAHLKSSNEAAQIIINNALRTKEFTHETINGSNYHSHRYISGLRDKRAPSNQDSEAHSCTR